MKSITVGFTGTHHGMTPWQVDGVKYWLTTLQRNGYKVARHGDCIGSDEQFHGIAKDMGFQIIIHPPRNPKRRAYCKNANLVLSVDEYLKRDDAIIAASSIMLATPRGMYEELRSGTWATIRHTRKANVQVEIIYPRWRPL